jgi:hypothetical protein
MSGHDHNDPKQQALVWKPREERDLDHFTREWWSGTRGGGSVPKDFTWGSNPKQTQEENGAGDAEKPISR